jgi:hypothetical protein
MNTIRKKIYAVFQVIVIPIIIGGLVFLGLSFIASESDNPGFQERFQRDYSIYSIEIPDTMDFAGERVPLEHFDVREALDRELLVNTYWQSHTLLLIKRANRYFPQIEKILEEKNVPEDFKYISLIESELLHAVSPSGAVGFWQFLEGTAEDYGLEVNHQVDERYNIEKATKAAAEFLKDAHEKFGSWTLAAASYNVGRSALMEQIELQDADNYYDLLLNTETGRYVYRILAVKLILENPEKYGFNLSEESLYYPIPTYEVQVDSTINNFADFAGQYSVSYKVLKIFNPWLRKPYLNNKRGKTYTIRFPKDGYRDYKKIFNEHKSGN